jgi:hypothetical protein
MSILDDPTPTPDTPDYDPTLPVYAEPENNFQDADVNLQDSASYVDPALATVEGRVTNLMSEGNPLLDAARAQNNRDYQKRGLLNSAKSVEGGTFAMLNAATNIATPDAALYGQLAGQQQKGDIDAAMNNQVASLENNQRIMDARLSAALQDMDFQGNVEMQKLIDTSQMQRVEVDNKWKQLINYDNMEATMRQTMMQVAQGIGQELTGGIERILRDTNISDKTSAVQALIAVYESQMITAGEIAGLNLSWA